MFFKHCVIKLPFNTFFCGAVVLFSWPAINHWNWEILQIGAWWCPIFLSFNWPYSNFSLEDNENHCFLPSRAGQIPGVFFFSPIDLGKGNLDESWHESPIKVTLYLCPWTASMYVKPPLNKASELYFHFCPFQFAFWREILSQILWVLLLTLFWRGQKKSH